MSFRVNYTQQIRELAEKTITAIENQQRNRWIRTDPSRIEALQAFKTVVENKEATGKEIIVAAQNQVLTVEYNGDYGPKKLAGSTFLKEMKAFIAEGQKFLRVQQQQEAQAKEQAQKFSACTPILFAAAKAKLTRSNLQTALDARLETFAKLDQERRTLEDAIKELTDRYHPQAGSIRTAWRRHFSNVRNFDYDPKLNEAQKLSLFSGTQNQEILTKLQRYVAITETNGYQHYVKSQRKQEKERQSLHECNQSCRNTHAGTVTNALFVSKLGF
jgi:hypothetical protein